MELSKLFSEKQVAVSGVLGGPLPAGILFYLNYKRLGKEKEAYIAIAVTLLFTVILLFTLIALPGDLLSKIPDSVFSGFYGILITSPLSGISPKRLMRELQRPAKKRVIGQLPG